jgi:hypothetical protein
MKSNIVPPSTAVMRGDACFDNFAEVPIASAFV